ncbi:oxidoreductase, aldo/keto reductase family [Verrucomicrobiia bacterium DG1235]|nr:oxidoreductase, aldo/keto reductase family [Verrucomicrobiae bacterium DG1235]
MNTRQLGNSDLNITSVGFGAWAVGGDWKFGWGAQDDRASIAAIHRSLEAGVNWIDTAPVYGLGHSEEVVRQALAEWSGPKPYVFTKCGMIWDDKGEVGYSGRRASIRHEVEASLTRLGVDTIDLYQMHWPMDELEETLEGWSEMAKLQEEGKVRYIGASNYNFEELEKAREIAPITSLQPPYSLVDPAAQAELLPYCKKHGIGSIVYSPMGSGLLTGAMSKERLSSLPAEDWRKNNPKFQEPNLSRNLAIAERLKTVAAKHGRSPGEVAIAWVLRLPAVTGAIVGARSAEQVSGIVRAMDFRLSAEDIAFIEG